MFKKILYASLVGIVCAIIAYLRLNDTVTAFCLGIIFGVFSYFFQEILQLKNVCAQLEKIVGTNILEELTGTRLQNVADSYKKTINIEIDRSQKTNIPSSEFFNTHSIAYYSGVNLRSLDSASGMLVGLGLMGTFLGLTIGIANFDSSNSENIQNSIQVLLNGMWIAFLTSLFGMGLSIINTGFDKHWRNKLYVVIKEITDKLDNDYYVDDMALLEYRNRRMLHFIDEEGNEVSLSSAIGHILEENKTQTEALSSFSTDLSTNLNNSLGEQIELKLSPIFKQVIEHIDQMAETVVTPANDMMEKVASELKYSMALVVNEFKKKVSDVATQQLESISHSLSSASKSIDQLPNNVNNAVSTMQEAIAKVEKTMLTLTEDIMSRQADLLALQESTTKESKSLIEGIQMGAEKLSEVNENFKYTIGAFKQSQEQICIAINNLSSITDSVQSAATKFEESQADYAENMKYLQIQSQGSIDSATQLVTHSGEMSREYASQFTVIKEGLTGIFEKLKEGLEEYSNTMQQTTQDYLQQYSRSLTETADSLKTSIDIMSDTISDFSEIIEKNKEE